MSHRPSFAALWRAMALIAALLATSPARALVQIWDGCCGAHLVKDTAPTASIYAHGDESMFLSGEYQATASSNLGSGTVSGWIDDRRTDFPVYGPLEVHTWSDVSDTITFHGSAPTTVDFTFTVTGSFEIGVVGGLYATTDFFVGGSATTFRIVWGAGPSEPTALYFTNGLVSGISMDPLALMGTIHISRTVVPEEPFSIGARLQLQANPSYKDYAVANFGHTGRIGFDVPRGYTFTSASGEFMTHAVPEPASARLLLAGLALIGTLALRHRRLGKGLR